MMNYHAHIYFDLDQSTLAQNILEAAKLQTRLMQVFWLIPKNVGPHTKPMFEIHFNQDQKREVIKWIEENRKGLSVLIHQDTGDDFRDHRPENILWLGEELPLDLSFFHLVKKDPTQALHK